MTTHLPGLPLPVSAVEKPLGASPSFSLLKSIVVVCAETAAVTSQTNNKPKEPIVNFMRLPLFLIRVRPKVSIGVGSDRSPLPPDVSL